MDRSLIYFGLIMLGGFFLISLITPYLPPDIASKVGGGLFIGVIIGGIGILEGTYRVLFAKYPYAELILRPDNEKADVFIERSRCTTQLKEHGLQTDTITCAFPIKFTKYGDTKITRFKLNHYKKFGEVMGFLPGDASKDDYDFPHGQTEIIEVRQSLDDEIHVDQGEVIPVFDLISSRNYHSGDLRVSPSPGVDHSESDAENLRLTNELEKARNENMMEHQRYISSDRLHEQQRSETRALLDSKDTIEAFALEFDLELIKAKGSIDRVAEYLKGSKWNRWGRELFFAVLAVGGFAYIYMHPEIIQGAQQWMGDPTHTLIVALIIVIVAAVSIYSLTRRNE